jgi:hypothetical protein
MALSEAAMSLRATDRSEAISCKNEDCFVTKSVLSVAQ